MDTYGISGTQTSETPSGESLLNYYSAWTSLRAQLHQYKVKLKSSQASTNTSVSGEDEIDALKKRISKLNDDLLEVSTLNMIKSSLLQSLQLGQTTLQSLFPSSLSENNVLLKSQVDQVTDLVSTVLRIHQEMNELQTTLTDLKLENAEMMRSCRELMTTHQQMKSDQQRMLASQTHQDQRIKRAEKAGDHLVDKLELLQNCLQGLILASGINWNNMPELKTLVFELGQSVEELID